MRRSEDLVPLRFMALAIALLLPSLAAAQGATYTNPVIPGDHPDPSVVRVGDDYWATATTSQWAPIFPILHSRDLVNWTTVGAVFEKAPAWSAGSYWAPEIAHHEGRFFVYYTARKKDGPLCIAAASAPKATGPWQDHGPMLCQPVGSIDAVPVSDEQGRRYLVWKEDGNSRQLPTPLWLQPLAADGVRFEGKRVEILRNEARWEAHLIEGPFIVRRNGWYYLFYSADACCGRKCNYKLGVARARALTGPWERNPANPILAGNQSWSCPGHGSIVEDGKGRMFLLYHAYHPEDFEYAGRQGMLDEVTWGENGWPSINGGKGPSAQARAPHGVPEREVRQPISDEFDGGSLSPLWQWPWDRPPVRDLQSGALVLRASGRDTGNPVDTVVARPTRDGDYVAITRVLIGTNGAAMAGLAAYGNSDNAIGLSVHAGQARLWQREKGRHRSLAHVNVPDVPAVLLRLTAKQGRRYQFAMSADGTQWTDVGEEISGEQLPPWDLAVRVALAVGGPAGSEGRFDWVRMYPAGKTAPPRLD